MTVIVLVMYVVYRSVEDVNFSAFLEDFIYDRMKDIFGQDKVKMKFRLLGRPDILKTISDEHHFTVLVKDFLPSIDVAVRFFHTVADEEKEKWIIRGDNAEFLVGSIVVLEFISFLGFHKELKTVPPARFMDVWDML